MTIFKHPSDKIWVIIYVVFPMMPFWIGGLIRLITTSWKLSWTTFSASELAICLALLSILINQNLLKSERVLDNNDKKDEAELQACYYFIAAILFVVLFGLITAFSVLVYELQLELLRKPLHSFEIFVFIAFPFMLWYSISAQRSFRLKTKI